MNFGPIFIILSIIALSSCSSSGSGDSASTSASETSTTYRLASITTTTIKNGVTSYSKNTVSYDSSGKPTDYVSYDLPNGIGGSETKKSLIHYSYSNNLLDEVSTASYDSNGNLGQFSVKNNYIYQNNELQKSYKDGNANNYYTYSKNNSGDIEVFDANGIKKSAIKFESNHNSQTIYYNNDGSVDEYYDYSYDNDGHLSVQDFYDFGSLSSRYNISYNSNKYSESKYKSYQSDKTSTSTFTYEEGTCDSSVDKMFWGTGLIGQNFYFCTQ